MVKENKKASLDRQKEINKAAEDRKRKSQGQDSRKVHDTKGKNEHSRRYQ